MIGAMRRPNLRCHNQDYEEKQFRFNAQTEQFGDMGEMACSIQTK